MTKPDPKQTSTPGQQSREARLAKALRENLRRRKAPPPAPPESDKPED
jgi:hypothetical protein